MKRPAIVRIHRYGYARTFEVQAVDYYDAVSQATAIELRDGLPPIAFWCRPDYDVEWLTPAPRSSMPLRVLRMGRAQ